MFKKLMIGLPLFLLLLVATPFSAQAHYLADDECSTSNDICQDSCTQVMIDDGYDAYFSCLDACQPSNMQCQRAGPFTDCYDQRIHCERSCSPLATNHMSQYGTCNTACYAQKDTCQESQFKPSDPVPVTVDPIPACKTPIVNSTSCIDKIENGQYIEHYSFSCLPGYTKSGDQCVGGSVAENCQSPYVAYQGQCVDPVRACENPIAHSTGCIDKIDNGQTIEHYNFSCLPGYEKTADQCVGGGASDNCQFPFVEYLGECVDPIPACKNPPANVMPSSCIDKIENGQYVERYNFQCKEGFIRSVNVCVFKNNYQPAQVSTTPIPTAGYEDEVIVNPESFKNPFPDTNISYIEGKAASELYRRGVLGGYPDGEFKGMRPVNRAEAAKFLLLARFGTVEDLKNTGKFSDVAEGQWYVKFVVKAANLGIIEGYADGTFKPQNTVNTAEFLKMLTKTFGIQENLAYSYTDVNANVWFARYAGTAQKYDLFPNRGTSLNPGKNMTRDEVAVAIYQYLKNR